MDDWWRLYHRLAVAYRPHRPESTFKGTALCLLRHHFRQEQQWLIVSEALLREIAQEQLPPSTTSSSTSSGSLPSQESIKSSEDNDGDEGEDGRGEHRYDGALELENNPVEEFGSMSDCDEEMTENGVGDDEEMDIQLEIGALEEGYSDSSDDEDGDDDGDDDDEYIDEPTHPNVSMDSQGLMTYEARRKANRPDFIVSKFGGALFTNQTHLYVEVKNGSTRHTAHTKQLMRYINKISKAIPPGFLQVHRDVVLMLVDAGTTYYWRITPNRVNSNRKLPIWEWAQKDDTLGDRINEILVELSQRPNVPLS
ncbi:hypothetical protein RSOL_163360, partial [Rhizoctonia solani AG-3 Rhs1AP]